jgi:5-hydroxyisourate hydrolase
MSLSTHVLDVAAGRPAAGVQVRLERSVLDGTWAELASGQTGPDGRLDDWLPDDEPDSGLYRLTLGSGAYFGLHGVPTLYPEVTITFEVIIPAEHLHLPVLLSPFGYTTYRGT